VTDLTPELLVSAYAQGYFPMDVEGDLMWFSPDPRGILPLESFHASKTLRQTYRNADFEIRVDTAFEETIRECGRRPGGTWISGDIITTYTQMQRMGLAHSVEAWQNGKLAGGLYGVALRGAFFGESMFHRVRDASKVALVALVERMRQRGLSLLDIQWVTPHLKRFGAIEISRQQYLRRLAAALRQPCSFTDAEMEEQSC
jgi:leucyl/phenylalanyl-tRNA---protein transferase